MEHAELAAWLRLLLTDGIGSATARRLLAAFGLPQAVFLQPREALRQVVSSRQADALLREPDKLSAQIETTQRWLHGEQEGVQRRLITLGDALYPPSLLNIEDPPALLYVEGRIGVLERSGWPPRAIAIVGSRSPTPQGALNARRFAADLVRAAGASIISGMALGIDGAAHEGALEACGDATEGIATIAVTGTGLDLCYPRRHEALAQRIARCGLLVSEYPLGTPPAPPNFPRRNRIIAGLAHGTLVVEAALRSGSLITARLAAEQGKTVFAVPGSIHSQLSRGAHDLIRQGACLAESAQDMLEEMQWDGSAPAPASAPATPSPAAPEAAAAGDENGALLRALGADPVSLDALQARTGWPTEQLQVRLLELELAGQLARLPGGMFQRIARA